MDFSAIITGIISAFSAILICVINNRHQVIESEKKHEAAIMLINYQLEELKKEVAKHNNIIERTYQLERDQAVTNDHITQLDSRLDNLERGA